MSSLIFFSILKEYSIQLRCLFQTGGTCLINSVQSEQLCAYLISKGAEVNAPDIQNKTGN